MKNHIDNFMMQFYSELNQKYQDMYGGEIEEENWFSSKKPQPKEKVGVKKKTGESSSLIKMIETFFTSLVDHEVEEQFLTYDEFMKLEW